MIAPSIDRPSSNRNEMFDLQESRSLQEKWSSYFRHFEFIVLNLVLHLNNAASSHDKNKGKEAPISCDEKK